MLILLRCYYSLIISTTNMGCQVKFYKYLFALVIFININAIILGDSFYRNDQVIRRSKRSSFCPTNTQCVPISSCPYFANVLDNNCVLKNRIGELGCGEPGLVCCPQVSQANTILPGKVVDGFRCGFSQVQGDGYEGIGAFPWIARIGYRNLLNGEIKYPCTGSIISSKIILTAAHCALAKADNFKLYIVRVGEWNTNTEIDCGLEFCGLPTQDVSISHVVVHPGYEKNTYRHNIALIVLKSALNFTVTAQPICLPESWSVTSNNAFLVGWGKAAGQTYTPSKQQVLQLPIIGLQQCVQVYGRTLPINDEQLCAGGESGNDACSGFGGAPLIVKHGNTNYQVGILSFGSDQCGSRGVPSVYTDVKKYSRWIKENTPQIYNN